MMADAPVSESVQVRAIEMFENERYSPLSGWSFKGLLPSDRNAFTTCDGRDGFSKLDEATEAFISLGWFWVKDSTWKVDMSLNNVDADGWTYSTDFTSLKDETYGSKVKGALHFVRRRKYVRFQSFDAKLLAPAGKVLTCSYCDFEEVERLAALLLDKLALASTLKHPAKNSEAKTVALKNRMIDALQLSTLSNSRETITYYLSMIEGFLVTFVNQSKSTWSAASGMMSSESHEETLRKRTAWLSNTFFTNDEAHELARLIIRALDKTNAYHCDQVQCGEKCEFYVCTCPNAGCATSYSRKWTSKHDEVCPHKIVPCERVCGENLKRLAMPEHLAEECGLRIVQCPCFDLGCETEIFAREVENHVLNSQMAHMCLVAKRIKEVQVVLGKHQSSINALDATTKDQQRALAGLTAGAATALGLIKASESHAENKLKDSVRALESKIAKDGTAIAANRSDINAIKAHLKK